VPKYQTNYSSIVLDFDMGEESRVAEIGLAAGTYIVSIIWLIAASSSSSAGLIGMF
jgi:hypothetical protein